LEQRAKLTQNVANLDPLDSRIVWLTYGQDLVFFCVGILKIFEREGRLVQIRRSWTSFLFKENFDFWDEINLYPLFESLVVLPETRTFFSTLSIPALNIPLFFAVFNIYFYRL